MIRLYETIGRNVAAANIQWFQIMRNFGEQYNYPSNRRKLDDTDTTKISKVIPIINCNEAFGDHIHF